jgi:NAD(P)-dependent dehydrogenase (short-subunit alcohol dehydrogenase family)
MNSYQGTPFDMRGRTCFISGAAGLLGREFSFSLASAGATLFLADLNEQGLLELRTQIRERYPDCEVLTLVLDVMKKDSITRGVENCVESYNKIDVLIHSAAIDAKFEAHQDTTQFTKFTEYPVELWQKSLDVNLTGAFLLTQAVAKVMEAQNEGSIIFIGSNYGMVGPDQTIYQKTNESRQSFKPADYSTCKAGLLGLTKYLAAYYARTKIRVNILTPAGVFNRHGEEFTANYSRNTLLNRMADKSEFNGAILFLSSSASSYMTGSNLVIDGGWTS